MTTIRPPVKWHGGRHYLAQRIVDLFPPHQTYVEPFGGAASVLAVLRACNGKVVLSGYPSELYDSLYASWRVEEIEMPNHAAGGRSKARNPIRENHLRTIAGMRDWTTQRRGWALIPGVPPPAVVEEERVPLLDGRDFGWTSLKRAETAAFPGGFFRTLPPCFCQCGVVVSSRSRWTSLEANSRWT